MRSGIVVFLALAPAIASAQSIDGIARCANGAGITNVPVCVGETVTCTAKFTNVDVQPWIVTLLSTTTQHPSGDEGGANLLTSDVTLATGADVMAAGVFVARDEDIPTVTVEAELDATAETGGGKILARRVVDVMTCTTDQLRLAHHAYRHRSYRVVCTDEGGVRVCHNRKVTFTGTR